MSDHEPVCWHIYWERVGGGTTIYGPVPTEAEAYRAVSPRRQEDPATYGGPFRLVRSPTTTRENLPAERQDRGPTDG